MEGLECCPLRQRWRFRAGHDDASDFRRLYAKRPLHAGLVVIIPNVSRIIQQRLFRGALDVLVAMGEPINRVLEVDIEGDEVTFDLYDLPANLP
jgi:hypothetical protein